MRSWLLLAAAVVLSGEAPPPDLHRFDQLLEASQHKDAAKFLDTQIEARRPADGKPRPDPLLNALLGRFYVAVHQTNTAAIYLDHAPLAELPQSVKPETALARAKVLELAGDRAGALQSFRDAAATASTDAERRRGTIGAARQMLADNPNGVIEQVTRIASGPALPDRWEANYLTAVANSLLGNREQARVAADRAWSDAANAPLMDLAPLHVAVLRAGLAAANRDMPGERAMLTAANGLAVTAAPALSDRLPTCGDQGVLPSDWVTFGFLAGPFGNRQLVPIAASRTAIVSAFQDSLGPAIPVKQGDGTKPIGTVFTVACRTLNNSGPLPGIADRDPILAWFVEHGIYPAAATSEVEDEHLNFVADRIDAIAAKFGKESPLLTEPRLQMMTMLEARALAGDPVLPGQIVDLAAAVSAGMKAAGAPDWLASAVQDRARTDQLAMASDGQDHSAEAQALFTGQMLKMPVRLGMIYLQTSLDSLSGEWPPAASQFVLDFSAKALPTLAGRERRNWLMTVSHAQRALGKDAAAKATLASANLPADLCAAMDTQVSLLKQEFSYNDYPEALIAGEQEGAVFYEFNLTANGDVTSPRIIYSLPSGLFDQPSAKGLSTVHYNPPTRNGRKSPCRAVYQPIVWRLEEGNDAAVPTLTPSIAPPTT